MTQINPVANDPAIIGTIEAEHGCGCLSEQFLDAEIMHFRLKSPVTLILVFVSAVAGGAVLLMMDRESSNPRPKPNVCYAVTLSVRMPTGEYQNVKSLGGYIAAIPFETRRLEFPGDDFGVQIRGIRMDATTVTFSLMCRGEEQTVVATGTGDDVFFDNGAFKVTIEFVSSTIPPFTANDSRLKLPIVACKLDPRKPARRGAGAIETRTLKDKKVHSELLAIMSDTENLEIVGSDCYEPGLAFRCGNGDEQIYIEICLECSWLHIYEPGNKNVSSCPFYEIGRDSIRGIW